MGYLKKIIFIIFIFFSIYDVNLGQEFEVNNLYKPSVLKIGTKAFYVIDGYKVKVFSKKTKKLLYELGKKGEGPGEFSHKPNSIQFLKDKILCGSPYKIMYFSYKGTYINEVKTGKATRLIQKLGNTGYVGVQLANGKNSITDINLNLYDNQFNLKKILSNKIYESKKAKIGLFVMFSSYFHIETDGENIVYADASNKLQLNIYDIKSKNLCKINVKQKPIRLTNSCKETIINCWKTNYRRKIIVDILKKTISFPEFFPPIITWKLADKKIFIITVNKLKDRNQCLIYNLKGKLIKEVYIHFESDCEILYKWHPFDIYKNNFYQLKENSENEKWTLSVSLLK